MRVAWGRERREHPSEVVLERRRHRAPFEPALHREGPPGERVKPRLRDHPRKCLNRVLLRSRELLDARTNERERELVDLAERPRVPPREIGHRRARIGLDEAWLGSRARMELAQVEHALVLVTKGTQVGLFQRC